MRQPGDRAAGRSLWFQFHKWIGLLFLVVLIPLSASGSLLVWHDGLDSLVNPQRYAVSAAADPRQIPAYLSAARSVLEQGDRIGSIAFPEGTGKPVVVTALRDSSGGGGGRSGPPPRYQVWLDPGTANVLDHADANTGLVRTMHVLHGSLMVPGVGRTIVGWLGVFMFFSCLTGIYLWWPTIGGVLRGFRWKRGPLISGNLHHQVGIWIVVPLAVLCFTGAYISFPTFFRSVESMFSSSRGDRRPAAPPDRRAKPLSETRIEPQNVVSSVLERASGEVLQVRWPTDRSADWTITVISRHGEEADYKVDDTNGEVERAKARGGAARFMRTLHDGHGYNVLWQIIIFIAGVAPALLGTTGVIMWLRTRGWRRKVVDRRASSGRLEEETA